MIYPVDSVIQRLNLLASSRCVLGAGREKEGQLATTYNSLEFEYLHRKSQCEKLIGRDDISNDVITLGTCFSIFVYIRVCFRFALIGGNLTAQSTGATGNWMWNSNFRGVVEGSPSVCRLAARASGELARRLLFCYIQKNRLHSHLLEKFEEKKQIVIVRIHRIGSSDFLMLV